MNQIEFKYSSTKSLLWRKKSCQCSLFSSSQLNTSENTSELETKEVMSLLTLLQQFYIENSQVSAQGSVSFDKALFRALKTKSATPKYGLLFHASLVLRGLRGLRTPVAKLPALSGRERERELLREPTAYSGRLPERYIFQRAFDAERIGLE